MHNEKVKYTVATVHDNGMVGVARYDVCVILADDSFFFVVIGRHRENYVITILNANEHHLHVYV